MFSFSSGTFFLFGKSFFGRNQNGEPDDVCQKLAAQPSTNLFALHLYYFWLDGSGGGGVDQLG